MQLHLIALCVTFVSVFLKGFQHKNVIAKKMRLVVITSYLMAVGDVLVIGMVVKGGYGLIPACGTGAALGMYLSIKLHDKFFS